MENKTSERERRERLRTDREEHELAGRRKEKETKPESGGGPPCTTVREEKKMEEAKRGDIRDRLMTTPSFYFIFPCDTCHLF